MDKTQNFGIGDLVRNFNTISKVVGLRSDGFLLLDGEYKGVLLPWNILEGFVDIGKWYADPAKCENLTKRYGLV